MGKEEEGEEKVVGKTEEGEEQELGPNLVKEEPRSRTKDMERNNNRKEKFLLNNLNNLSVL